MPTARSNGIEMYYEEHGSGEPLLLIMGWSGNAATWRPQIPGLAERYRVIVFDNRGAGRTAAPAGPYSIKQMAEDAAGLMDALQLERANVFGVSMGGMVAQELALSYPDRVGSLVLGCTSPGGKQAAGFSQLRDEIEGFYELHESGGLDLQWFAEFLKRLWTDGALARSDSRLQDFVFSLIRFPPTMRGMRDQAEAVLAHNAYDRLERIEQPTLVITGDEDSLIDPRNSAILAERIPGAQLAFFGGLKHAFHLERPEQVNALIIEFIEDMRRQANDNDQHDSTNSTAAG